jgi:formylglycine-generating enzyme required for sulfatase activity
MVVIPAGRFMMGSPDDEKGRDREEGPMHEVRITYTFAVGKYPVTRGQWRQFVKATGHPKAGCYGDGDWESPSYFQQAGVSQDDSHPVVCISWHDATAYTVWLSQKTGHHYRLLSDAEYEYVNRAGSTTRYFWGDSEADLCRYANGGLTTLCNPEYTFTSPVGHFLPNGFGLYDTTGNVWEWVQDRSHNDYKGAEVDRRFWEKGSQSWVVRGGGWQCRNVHSWCRSAARGAFADPNSGVGFRVARDDR